jgi:hydroxymethylglutaryl-CoA reductase
MVQEVEVVLMSEQKISSRLSGFFKLSIEERQAKIQELCALTTDDIEYLALSTATLGKAGKGYYIENPLTVMQVPLGIAPNFKINGEDVLVPMAVEEASVVAGAANSAKVARASGGFFTSSTDPIMIGQIQIIQVPDPLTAENKILERKTQIIEIANQQDPMLVKFGGGCRDVRVKVLEDTLQGPMVITELLVDVRDAMGANAVNTMNEAVAPLLADITGGRTLLKIISNLADQRLASAKGTFKASELATETLSGKEVVEGILNAYAFADADPYRCSTHNKGIMNGIDAVALATAQDWRAIEAGAHTYAAIKVPGKYSSLTTWEKDSNGDLIGTIELPLAVGVVGGIASLHPLAQISFKIMGLGVPGGAQKLAETMAAVGLAQNFAALRALVTVGIQAGHMRLHARNLAASMGAAGLILDKVVDEVTRQNIKVTFDNVKKIFDQILSK